MVDPAPGTPVPPDTKDWTWVLERPCPDCGFATFADNPIVDAATAEAVLRALVTVRDAIG